MNTADNNAQRDAYNWASWLVDDDTPSPPEPDPITSARSRRAWRTPAPCRA